MMTEDISVQVALVTALVGSEPARPDDYRELFIWHKLNGHTLRVMYRPKEGKWTCRTTDHADGSSDEKLVPMEFGDVVHKLTDPDYRRKLGIRPISETP